MPLYRTAMLVASLLLGSCTPAPSPDDGGTEADAGEVDDEVSAADIDALIARAETCGYEVFGPSCVGVVSSGAAYEAILRARFEHYLTSTAERDCLTELACDQWPITASTGVPDCYLLDEGSQLDTECMTPCQEAYNDCGDAECSVSSLADCETTRSQCTNACIQ